MVVAADVAIALAQEKRKNIVGLTDSYITTEESVIVQPKATRQTHLSKTTWGAVIEDAPHDGVG